MPSRDQHAESVRTFWDTRAREHGTGSGASMPDKLLIEKEIDVLSAYLEDDDRVLDVGCANGYSTLRFALNIDADFIGVDFSPVMIEEGQKAIGEFAGNLKGAVRFKVDDILKLSFEDDAFDKVVCKRVLINLESVEQQLSALERIHAVLAPGGVLLMSEACKKGWQNLNALRQEFGLDELAMPWHNLYLDEEEILPRVEHLYELLAVEAFSSTYYIGSRVVQPFVLGRSREPTYDSAINKLFAELPSFGDFGYQKLFVLRKR